MFGEKSEKALEEGNQQAGEKEEAVAEAIGNDEQLGERVGRLSDAQIQIQEEIRQIEDDLKKMVDLVNGSTAVASDIRSAFAGINHAVESFDANHSVFLRSVREQSEQMREIVKSSENFSEPLQQISKIPETLKADISTMQKMTEHMMGISQNMGFLALNAAIEAGKLGESGDKFIMAAEEVRIFSEEYDRSAKELSERLQQSVGQMDDLFGRVQQLSSLLKENHVSMEHLLEDSLKTMESYETGKNELYASTLELGVQKIDTLSESKEEGGEVKKEQADGEDERQEELK